LLHLKLLRVSFCFHESHTFYSTSPWNKKKLYKHLHMLYQVGGLITCVCKRISSLHETSHEFCMHDWLYTYIRRFYFQKYCWKFFYTSENLWKVIRNNIKIKKNSTHWIRTLNMFLVYDLFQRFKPRHHWGLFIALSMVNVYSVSLVMGT
jgi:hypothetical protein